MLRIISKERSSDQRRPAGRSFQDARINLYSVYTPVERSRVSTISRHRVLTKSNFDSLTWLLKRRKPEKPKTRKTKSLLLTSFRASGDVQIKDSVRRSGSTYPALNHEKSILRTCFALGKSMNKNRSKSLKN